MTKNNNTLPRKYNVPDLKSYQPLQHLHTQIEDTFKTRNRHTVILVGEPGSGKTTSSIDYARTLPDYVIVFLNAFGINRLDFEYRQFASEYLKLPMRDRNRRELIDQVNQHLDNQKVLFIFDDAKKLSDLTDYIDRLPPMACSLVTTSNTSSEDTPRGAGFVYQQLLSMDQSIQFLESKLTSTYRNTRNLNEIVKTFHTLERGAYPRDLQLCCSFINHSKMSFDESISALKKMPILTHSVLEHLRKSNESIDLPIYLSLIDDQCVPMSLISAIYGNPLDCEAELEVLENYSLVRYSGETGEKCVCLGRTTSGETLEWAKKLGLRKLKKYYEQLLKVLETLFVEDRTNLKSIRLYYPNVVHLLSVDVDFPVHKMSLKDTQLELNYRLAFFTIYYLRNPQKALEYLGKILNSIKHNDLISSKTFRGKVHFLKGNQTAM